MLTLCRQEQATYNEVMPRGYITTTQAAERLGITRHAVIALIKRGSLPADKFGTAWIIREKDLEKVRNRKVGRPRKDLTK
ncbi:MAG: helix-turn-helix domain-containing protein [Anaerolineae bacterium]|nr:helix-turn-helix domain-containing protein [Anaerolineae bacterium]